MHEIEKVGEYVFSSNISVQVLEHKEHGLMFAAFSVAEKLGYSNPRDAVYTHCKRLIKLDSSVHRHLSDIEGLSITHGITLIKESDLYRLIMRSTLPEAEAFQDWVCEEVLPQIRKSGFYSIEQKYLTEQKELQDQLNNLSSMLLKNTHSRISALEKQSDGTSRLTQKDRRLVDIEQSLLGNYTMQACSLSKTISLLKQYNITIPEFIRLKDGRVLKGLYKDISIDLKLSAKDVIERIRCENGQDLLDFT
jgi:prophage antirepressor-like protein